MNMSTYPSTSKELRSIYKKYLESGADPNLGLRLIDKFILSYPYFTEAILFKARMLMAVGNYNEAETYINMIKSIDEWNTSYIYDEAELIYNKDRKRAIDYLDQKLDLVFDNIFSGIINFLLSTRPEERDEIKKEILSKLVRYVENKAESILNED